MEIRKCPECGAEIPDGGEYCEQCGYQMKQETESNQTEAKEQTSEPEEATAVSQDEVVGEASETEKEQAIADNKEAVSSQGKKKINRAIVISAIGWIGPMSRFSTS